LSHLKKYFENIIKHFEPKDSPPYSELKTYYIENTKGEHKEKIHILFLNDTKALLLVSETEKGFTIFKRY
jgi:hypothetical protein